MNFKGEAIAMRADDIPATANDLGLESATLRAVLTVETGGSGFDKEGRPKALFERHYFYKLLKDKPDELQRAVEAGVAYPKWGEKPYPKGSDAVYAEIATACEINLDCALRSVSWGLGQIMGNNYKLAGCCKLHGRVASDSQRCSRPYRSYTCVSQPVLSLVLSLLPGWLAGC